MPQFKTFKRSLLFGFMLATFLPLFISGYFSYTYLSYKIKESGQHNNELLAANVATEISSFLYTPLVTLTHAALLLQSNKHGRYEINDLLNAAVAQSDFLEIIYVINQGKIVEHIGLADEFTQLRHTYLGIDLSRLNILRNIEYLHAPYWTHSFLSPISGKKSIALIYPSDEGYYFVGLFNIGYFQSIVADYSRKTGIEMIILDDVGKPIFHPEFETVEELHSFANIKPFIKAQTGIFDTYEFQLSNRKFIGSTAIISETRWIVMVTQPLTMALQPIRNLRNFFLFAVFLSIIIVVPFALRQSKKLLKPLSDLQGNIQAIAGGDYDETISKQPLEEFEQVAIHFREMAEAIARRKQLLEINEERLVSLLELHNTKQLGEEELLEFAIEQAVKLARSEVGYIHFFDSDERSLTRKLWSSTTESFCERNGIAFKQLAGVDFWDESIRERRYVIKNETKHKVFWKQAHGLDIVVSRQLSVPIFDESKIVAVVGVLNKKTDYDATDARQLSLYMSNTWDLLQQKRSERERTQLAEKLAQAQKLEAIGTLAGGIAHDFNNVLMVIIGNTELAQEHINAPEKIRQDLKQIFKGALRARDLVNQILVFSRDNVGTLKAFDIQPIVKEAVKLLRSSIPANIEVRQNIAIESKPVLSEPGKIKQLIMNLSTNAYQAMEDTAGVLEISLRPVVLEHDLVNRGKQVVSAGDYMQMKVRDTGRGIPRENLERLFEPYFSTREKERGTGLGLAVVHGIVSSLKGGITVDSELGKGTTFTLYLPVAKEEPSTESQILTSNLPGGDEHILYVDDDEAVAFVNSKSLENIGYTVSTFSSSISALKEFQKDAAKFDLVISDMAMPEMTGEQLAGRILQIRQDVPIIICTGFSEKMDEKRAEELGVRELLTKPLTRVDLALTVRKVLGFQKK